MRADMAKVIVERPRAGGDGGRSIPVKGWYKNAGWDDLPSKEGMRRPYGFGRKELNEHLEPLRRYLRRQVGRPWNDVYADISRNLRPTSAVQQHVRDHVRWEVEVNATIGAKGRVYGPPRFSFGLDVGRQLRRGELYVDPESGVLKVVKRGR